MLKEKCDQLSAIFREMRQQNPEASILMMVSEKGKKKETRGTFSAISGDGFALAADLALLMHQAPDFAQTVKMAVKAYQDGPKPPKSLLVENLDEESTSAPAEEPEAAPAEASAEAEPTGDQLTREEVRDMIKTAFLGALDEAFAEPKQ